MYDKLISRNNIKEEIRLIKNSETDYISPSGNTFSKSEFYIYFFLYFFSITIV